MIIIGIENTLVEMTMIRKLTADAPAGQLIGYARVSTDGQDFAAQVERLKAAGCFKIYSEKESGAKRDREQLQAAVEYCRAGDTFVCVKADRIARSTKDFLDIIERLTAKGVGLKVLDQPELSGEGPTADMLRTILAAVSQFELSLIRDRMSEGRSVRSPRALCSAGRRRSTPRRRRR